MLIIWDWLPSHISGAGIVMRRLLASYPIGQLWALTTRQAVNATSAHDPIPAPEQRVLISEPLIRGRAIHKINALFRLAIIPWIIWRGLQTIRQESIQAIFTVPWDHFSAAAYFLHRITGLPLYLYVMDDPAGTRRLKPFRPPLYSLLMPRLVQSARRVWGIGHGMCQYLEQTYSVKCELLLPLLDIDDFQTRCGGQRSDEDTFHIVYTGSIYSAQLDSLCRVVRVLEQMCSDPCMPRRLRLTLYTTLPDQDLRRMGLLAPNVKKEQTRHEDIPKVLGEAHLLVLPLSFEPAMRHIVETSFPSKIAEYLASGTPILVHAPSYSDLVMYCRSNDCAFIVDEQSAAALREALMRLTTDSMLRNELAARALEIARKNHAASNIIKTFLEHLH